MGQLSIFNIGTGHHKGEASNLLVALHRDCTSRQAREGLVSSIGGSFKAINDGPGSVDEGAGLKSKLASVGGNAQGTGSTRGVIETTKAMVDLFERVKPDQVNICGHSRGAISSVRIAARLYEISPNTPVNLFLVDPVKRMAQGTDFHNREIHPNVARIVCVVMEDVGDKQVFKLMSLKRRGANEKKRTHLSVDKFIRMPGSHGTATQVDAPIGQVTYQLARRFLNSCGAPVGAGIWDDLQVCNEYFKIQSRNPVVTRKSKWLGRTIAERTVNDGAATNLVSKHSRRDRLDGLGITNEFHGDKVFVNEHHHGLFSRSFPSVTEACSGDAFARLALPGLDGEVTRLRNTCAEGYRLIHDVLNIV